MSLVSLVFSPLIAIACTPAATPTAFQAIANTPAPSPIDTLVPSPTVVPPTPTSVSRVEAEDPAGDGFHCVTGEKDTASTPLPAAVDVTRAWVEVDAERQEFSFGVEFGLIDLLNEQIIGGVHVYNPDDGLVEPFDSLWYFNNTTNWSLNFFFTPPETVTVRLGVVENGSWGEGTTSATAIMEGNVLTMIVPFEEVASNGTWGWGLTNHSFSVCEQVGYDETDRPSLALPPRP